MTRKHSAARRIVDVCQLQRRVDPMNSGASTPTERRARAREEQTRDRRSQSTGCRVATALTSRARLSSRTDATSPATSSARERLRARHRRTVSSGGGACQPVPHLPGVVGTYRGVLRSNWQLRRHRLVRSPRHGDFVRVESRHAGGVVSGRKSHRRRREGAALGRRGPPRDVARTARRGRSSTCTIPRFVRWSRHV